MKAILRLDFLKNIQDKGLLFWTIILPIIFTVLFISVFTNGADPETQKEVIVSIVPGYIVMFVFFIMITMVDHILKDLQSGMTARLASTPLKSSSYLYGKWITYFIIVLIQIIILFTFGKIVYQIPMMQPILLILFSIALSVMVTGLGLGLALSVRTFNMGIAITQIIALGGALLSGLWVPHEFLPKMIQTIGKFLPQYWAHQSMQEAMLGTLRLQDFMFTLVILLAAGMLGFIVAFSRYPAFLKRARN